MEGFCFFEFEKVNFLGAYEVEVIELKKNVNGNMVLLSRCVLNVITTKGVIEIDQWESCVGQDIPLIHLLTVGRLMKDIGMK